MAVWIGNGGLVEQVVVSPEVGDVFAHGLLGNLVCIGLLGRNFLRGHVLLELAWTEVHDHDLISGGAGRVGVGFGFPGVQVGVVDDHQVNAVCQRAFERLEIPPVIFTEPSDVEDIATVLHEVFVGRVDGDGKSRTGDRSENILCECRLARSRDGTIDEDGFHVGLELFLRWSLTCLYPTTFLG